MIFANTIIFGEGLDRAVTDEMTLKHASLQLSLHPRTKAPAYPPPEEGEDRLLPKKRKHKMHLFIKGHSGKIWKAEDLKDDPYGVASMA